MGVFRSSTDSETWTVECLDCGVEYSHHSSGLQASAAWNTRPTPSLDGLRALDKTEIVIYRFKDRAPPDFSNDVYVWVDTEWVHVVLPKSYAFFDGDIWCEIPSP